MFQVSLPEVIAQSSHRNGMDGAPLDVFIVRDQAGRRMLLVSFSRNHVAGSHWDDPDYHRYETAAFDLDLLNQNNITFGDNSWRGDQYEDALLRQGLLSYCQPEEEKDDA